MGDKAELGSESPGGVDYGHIKFSVSKHILQELADWAVVAVPSPKDTLPVLGCFQVSVDQGKLQLSGTDLERTVIAATAAVDAQNTSGVLYLPARKFLSIIKEAPQGSVHVEVKKNQATVTVQGGASWVLKLPDSSAYPELVDLSDVELKSYSRKDLLEALKSVKHCVCKDAGQPQLTQVDIQDCTGMSEGETAITASDRNRFSRVRLDHFPVEMTIPSGVLDDLLKLLNGSPVEKVYLGSTDRTLAFRVGPVVLAATKRIAKFPDMDKLLLTPALDNDQVFTVDREEFIGAIRQVKINADTETAAIALFLSNGTLAVLSKDKNGNSARKVLNVGWEHGDRLVVVNHQFLTDMLVSHGSESCSFKLGPDVGKRRSVVLLSDEKSVQILSQMPPGLVGY